MEGMGEIVLTSEVSSDTDHMKGNFAINKAHMSPTNYYIGAIMCRLTT